MGVDGAFLSSLRGQVDFDSTDHFVINGVRLELPTTSRGGRSWQRRVLDDLVPDFPVADASEKILYDIERILTDPDQAPATIPESLRGDFTPLVPLFYAQTTLKSGVPVAFHVTAVKTPERLNCRTLKERTFLLLCRNETGDLDTKLVREFLDRFRRPKGELDLAQRTFIDTVFPDFDPHAHALPNLESHKTGPRPFLPSVGGLFRRDLRTVLGVSLTPSEFFRITNVLIALHFGLYQPRLALALNRSMDALIEELAVPNSVNSAEVGRMELGDAPVSAFRGRLALRAPELGESRSLSTNAAQRESYRQMEHELAELHFSLLILNRIREVATAYLVDRGWTDETAIEEAIQYPSQFIARLQMDSEFRTYFDRATAALAARFIVDQLDEVAQLKGRQLLTESRSGLEALRAAYAIHNVQPPAKPTNTTAVKAGIQVTDGVLKRGEYGIIATRHRVGKYFELGTGLLPLLLLLIIGNDREKLSVHDWWRGLREYGFAFAPEEREILLGRLRSMGLYERFSDAGEANYIHNLMVGGAGA